MTPILLLGAGRMGGALIAGWKRTRAFDLRRLMVRDPAPGPEATDSAASINPNDRALGRAKTVVLAVKPQVWREAAEAVAPVLDPEAIIISIAAGVSTADLATVFGARRIARVMPTTAAAIGQGTASVYAADPEARGRAHALFEPLGTVVDLADEDLMHAATAVSGSSPAYLYAFIEALETAGITAGLPAEAAEAMARATIAGAAALLSHGGEHPADLRRQVTSPGGTTEAALGVLNGEHGLKQLLDKAVAAATQRSRDLGK